MTDKEISGRSLVNWGVTSKRQMNEFVTADALFVLKVAGKSITPVADVPFTLLTIAIQRPIRMDDLRIVGAFKSGRGGDVDLAQAAL